MFNIDNLLQSSKVFASHQTYVVFTAGLQRCHLIMETLTGVDVQDLEAIVDRYEQMVTERKLDFNFQPNQLPFF